MEQKPHTAETAGYERGMKRLSEFAPWLTPEEKNSLLADEQKAIRTGEWGEWMEVESDHIRPGSRHWRSKAYGVIVKEVDAHVKISIHSWAGIRPSWWDVQRIKNEIVGEDATAVEVYPPQSEVVDNEEVFHIWVVPRLPFSLHHRNHAAPEQRSGSDPLPAGSL